MPKAARRSGLLIARKDGTPSSKRKFKKAAPRTVPQISDEARQAIDRARDARGETASKARIIRMG